MLLVIMQQLQYTLTECFKSLPYDAVINENAANISGGEKQKISILRALLKNLDACTRRANICAGRCQLRGTKDVLTSIKAL